MAADNEPSRHQAYGAGVFPHLQVPRLRRMARSGLGEDAALVIAANRLFRTEPENFENIPAHVITLNDVTRGLGLDEATEQQIWKLVEDSSAKFENKGGTQHIVLARSKVLSTLRQSYKHVDPNARMEISRRLLAYWRRNVQTDYGKAPTLRLQTEKSLRHTISLGVLAKGPERPGHKYYKRVPTGNPKHPYEYYYTRGEYEQARSAARPAESKKRAKQQPQPAPTERGRIEAGKEKLRHIIGKPQTPAATEAQAANREQRTRGLRNLLRQLRRQPELATRSARLWVQSESFGLPKDTQKAHQEGGQYTPERQKLHDEIIRKFTSGIARVPDNKQPVAVVMMGGGGSGKGTIKKSVLGDHADFVNVDPDEVKENLPEYQEALNIATVKGKTVTAKNAAFMAHEESSDIAKRMWKTAAKNRQNLIMDGTGKDAEAYAEKIKELKKAGYHVKLIYAHVEKDEAIARAKKRADRSGRYVPDEVLEDAHTRIPGNFQFVAAHADTALLMHSKDPPEPIYQEPPPHAHNEDSWKQFQELGARLHKQLGITLPPPPKREGGGERLAASQTYDLTKGDSQDPDKSTEELIERIKKNSRKYKDEDDKGPFKDKAGGGIPWPEMDYEDEVRKLTLDDENEKKPTSANPNSADSNQSEDDGDDSAEKSAANLKLVYLDPKYRTKKLEF